MRLKSTASWVPVCWNQSTKKLFATNFPFGEFDLSDKRKLTSLSLKGKIIKGQRLDLVVEGQVVVEITAVRTLEDVFSAQVLSYLKSAGYKRALLINFGEKKPVDGIKRFSS